MIDNLGDVVALLKYQLTDGSISEEGFNEGMLEVSRKWSQVYERYLSSSLEKLGVVYGEDARSLAEELTAKECNHIMSQEDLDKYDTETYMVSETMGWYCKVVGDNRYWLFNGDWVAYVLGEDSEVCYHKQGHKDNEHVNVTDWKQVSGSYMYEHCEYFYRQFPPSVQDFTDFEDTISF